MAIMDMVMMMMPMYLSIYQRTLVNTCVLPPITYLQFEIKHYGPHCDDYDHNYDHDPDQYHDKQPHKKGWRCVAPLPQLDQEVPSVILPDNDHEHKDDEDDH